MKLKFILLLILSFSFVNQLEAQRRTTSVKGYTRKDGTYVRPHTRSYTSGSGYSSYSSGSTGSYNSLFSSTPSDSENSQNGEYLASTSRYNGEKIVKSQLNKVPDADENYLEGNIIYLSVLYYNNKVIDICPIKKDYSDWSFSEVYHSFNKNKLSSEDTLDLISNYGWSLNNDKLRKNFQYSSDKNSPTYLARTIEAMKLQQN
ncbi:hypothetical protein [Chryseobacterium lactis]|uniref:hypothetical protein n=1 Tax=Chryseobacterium lactis TaxID=1241981 RepID=UPI001624DF16|nr:hypothetical protein [Chryseobacterium lactis]